MPKRSNLIEINLFNLSDYSINKDSPRPRRSKRVEGHIFTTYFTSVTTHVNIKRQCVTSRARNCTFSSVSVRKDLKNLIANGKIRLFRCAILSLRYTVQTRINCLLAYFVSAEIVRWSVCDFWKSEHARELVHNRVKHGACIRFCGNW